jgi:hypothetical protein
VVNLRPIALPLAALLLLSCGAPAPESYPPPAQRRAPSESESRPVGPFVSMDDPDMENYVIRDVSLGIEAGRWRWTYRRPELRFWLDSTADQKLVVDFVVADATLAKTGPVTISFYVNDKLLGQQHCPKSGDYHFEKGVPASWLRTDAFTIVAAEADKLWVSPTDGARLGFILVRAGFVS